MIIITDIDSLHLKNTVVVLGNFDGIHKGHLTLLHKAKEIAESQNLKTVFFTFYPHPTHVLAPNEVKLINTDLEKQYIAEVEGMDYYLRFPFTTKTASINAENFIYKFLHQQIDAKAIVIGEDYSFGKGRRGNVNMLQYFEDEYGYKLYPMKKLKHKGEIISSTWIRKAIINADLNTVYELMGRDYFVSGEIVHGAQIGRTIGFPTANIKPNIHKQLPKKGVYITTIDVKGKTYYGLTNVGTKPTINVTLTEVIVETYIYDFDEMIYGEQVNVKFYKYLRDEDVFKTLDDLIVQMKLDELELIRYAKIDMNKKANKHTIKS